MARPRKYTAAEAARRNKHHKAQSAKRRAPVFNEKRRERRFRHRDLDPRHHTNEVHEIGAVVSALGLHRPNLLWIDAAGNVSEEKWESAEELIRRLQKKEKRHHAKETKRSTTPPAGGGEAP